MSATDPAGDAVERLVAELTDLLGERSDPDPQLDALRAGLAIEQAFGVVLTDDDLRPDRLTDLVSDPQRLRELLRRGGVR